MKTLERIYRDIFVGKKGRGNETLYRAIHDAMQSNSVCSTKMFHEPDVQEKLFLEVKKREEFASLSMPDFVDHLLYIKKMLMNWGGGIPETESMYRVGRKENLDQVERHLDPEAAVHSRFGKWYFDD